MKKYKFQCDVSDCKHQFVDDNPNCCPKCKKDDFTIISQENTNYKYFVIGGVFLILIVSLFFLYEDYKKKSVNNQKIVNEIRFDNNNDNFFEIIINSENIQDLNIINVDGKKFFRDGLKIFPCSSSNFKISYYYNQSNVVRDNYFNLKGNPDKRACKDEFMIIGVYPNKSTCLYEIKTTDNDNTSVSLNNSSFQKKLIWKHDECKNYDKFFVKNDVTEEILTFNIPHFACPKKTPPKKLVIIESFNLYISDPRSNRSQFRKLFDSFDYSTIFDFDSQQMNIKEFITRISAMWAIDPMSVKNLKIEISSININSDTGKIYIKPTKISK